MCEVTWGFLDRVFGEQANRRKKGKKKEEKEQKKMELGRKIASRDDIASRKKIPMRVCEREECARVCVRKCMHILRGRRK